jgi:hypothetical protein
VLVKKEPTVLLQDAESNAFQEESNLSLKRRVDCVDARKEVSQSYREEVVEAALIQ